MDTEIRIQRDDLIAAPAEDGQSYVCGNSGYTVRLIFPTSGTRTRTRRSALRGPTP